LRQVHREEVDLPFACEKRAGRVSSLSLVRYHGADYSVPTAYGHREVLVRGYVPARLRPGALMHFTPALTDRTIFRRWGMAETRLTAPSHRCRHASDLRRRMALLGLRLAEALFGGVQQIQIAAIPDVARDQGVQGLREGHTAVSNLTGQRAACIAGSGTVPPL
jgi:hypothetical protein